MFELVWDVLKLRICKVWQDERWWLYFQKTYLSVSESNGALTACWWNGPLCPHYKPGITPSWQPAESCNGKFKRDVLNVEIEDSEAPEKSHTAIVEAIETAIRVWTSPLDSAGRSGEPMSLMASEAAGKVSLSGPLSPDSWMLQQQEGILVRRWGKNPTRLPTIQDIAQASEDCAIVINTEARVHVVMRVAPLKWIASWRRDFWIPHEPALWQSYGLFGSIATSWWRLRMRTAGVFLESVHQSRFITNTMVKDLS